MSGPALPCPPWCQGHHDGPNAVTSHQLHRYEGGQIAQVPYATLYLSDQGADGAPVLAYTNGQLSLHVAARDGDGDQAVVIDLDQEHRRGYRQAEDLARFLGALGHPGLAAAIGELLELAELAKPPGYEPAAAESGSARG